jgi:hypothetical protein
MIRKALAPKSVQEFRKISRKGCAFYRGVNTTADMITDELIVWLVDDLLNGRIRTNEEAAVVVGTWMAEKFPYKKRKRSAILSIIR